MTRWLDGDRDMENIDSISRCLMRLKADYQQGLNFLRTEPNLRYLIVTFSEQLEKPIPGFLLPCGIQPAPKKKYARKAPYTRKWRAAVRKGQVKRRAREKRLILKRRSK